MSLTDTQPIHVYFNRQIEDIVAMKHKAELKLASDDASPLPVNIMVCNSWSQLSEIMLLKPKFITFYETEMIHTSINEVIKMVDTMSKMVGMEDRIALTVGITRNTSTKTIKELQSTRVSGIIPTHLDFGWDETRKALFSFWNNIPYWPKHILNRLPNPVERIMPCAKRVAWLTSISDEDKKRVTEFARSLNVEMVEAQNISDLFDMVINYNQSTDAVSIDYEYFTSTHGTEVYDIVSALKTLTSCKGTTLNVVGIVDSKATMSQVKALAKVVDKVGMRADDIFTPDQVADDIRRFFNGDMSTPQVVLDHINKKKLKNNKKDKITLTPRQTQIYNLISTRGASNKVISRMLNISESTVKLHTSAILKKYGVRNRTQLAVFAKGQEKDYV